MSEGTIWFQSKLFTQKKKKNHISQMKIQIPPHKEAPTKLFPFKVQYLYFIILPEAQQAERGKQIPTFVRH